MPDDPNTASTAPELLSGGKVAESQRAAAKGENTAAADLTQDAIAAATTPTASTFAEAANPSEKRLRNRSKLGPSGQPTVTFGDAILQFFHMLSLLLSGKTQDFDLAMNGPDGFKETYVDPVEGGTSTFSYQEQQTIRRMHTTLYDTRQTFDSGTPRIERLLKIGAMPGVQQLMDVIKKYESAGGNYDIGNGGREPTYNGKRATECTLREIIAMQNKGWGGASSAIGAYQVMPGTLKDSIARLGLDPDTTLYNKATQDLIGLDLMEVSGISGFIEDKSKYSSFMYSVAKVWASLPLDPSGKAAYGHLANNPDYVSQQAVTDTMAALNAINPTR